MAKLVSAFIAAALCGLVALALSTTTSAHVVPSPCDFTTGGGWVVVPEEGGDQANFGIVGGCKNEGFYGHVNYVDHNTGLHINGPVTAYYDPFPNGPSGYRDLCGTDSQTGTKYRVRTKDNGEPGGDDRFGIKLSDGYIVSTRELGPPGTDGGGGNIQLHKGNPSNTGPATPPDEIDACGADDGGLGM